MAGRHVGDGSSRHLTVPPLPEVHRDDVWVPQRERVTYLSHLQARFSGRVTLTSGFGVVNQELVLNVIPVRQQDDPRPPRRALAVGCAYVREFGEWWFYWVATRKRIARANDLARAETLITKATERRAAA